VKVDLKYRFAHFAIHADLAAKEAIAQRVRDCLEDQDPDCGEFALRLGTPPHAYFGTYLVSDARSRVEVNRRHWRC
jgi:hypothetical protein